MSYSNDIKKHTSKHTIPSLVLLCAVAYFVSYISRLSFSAVTVEMIASEGYSKALISIPLTGLFITYGLGQVISGFMGDKLSPEKMVFWGLMLSSIMNLLIPFMPSVALMTVVWCINGFAQAMMWPPIIKILTTNLTEYSYYKNMVYVPYGSSLGTVFIYLFSPVAITFFSWKAVFFFAAVIAFAVAIIWIKFIYRVESACEPTKDTPKKSVSSLKQPFHGFTVALLILMMIAMALQGVLRDGIGTWMPTYITEVFKVESTVSILTGVALPILSVAVIWISTYLYRKIIRNESLCSALFFALCILCIGALCLAPNSGAVLSVAMLVIANAATHGINNMYTCMVVPNFAKYGKTSLVTGLINSTTYVGSAISTYGVAVITDRFGWSGTMLCWLLISVAGLVVVILSLKPLDRLKRFNKSI